MTFFKATTLAATALAIVLSAAGSASALSLELPPGVELKQDCKDKTFYVTKTVHVRHGHKVIAVPKDVKITKTICESYYTHVSANPPSQDPKPLAYPEYHPDHKPGGHGVTGHNVGAVYFPGGAFDKRGNKWVETGPSGQTRFAFRETGRDKDTVYLYDRSRDMHLQLDLRSDMIMYQGSPLYSITSASR